MIEGIGIDVVNISRFQESLERTPALREKLFTEREAVLPVSSLAARFAAKEALAEKKKLEKEQKKTGKAVVAAAEPKAEDVPVKVTVKRIKIDGQEYLKSSANILYNPVTQEEVGMYDEATNSIKPLPDDEEEELEEDNYDN